ncbi:MULTISPECIES: chemotaxis protein CheC [Bacillus]|uniref:chemotaxis protein CheC n=1 Tax=Bacillus TaxID=1386 RepID=UPI000BB8E4B4|nr:MULTISPECIES: chemotaxis protein CheC [Bacillus]
MDNCNKSINQLDILKELGNIGAGMAATALSKLVNKKINMSVPSAKLVNINEMMDLVGGPELPVAAVFLKVEGELSGSLFFVLSLKDGTSLVKQLTHDINTNFETYEFDELAISALQELGNIICAHYLTALSNFTNLHVTPSVPQVGIDMVGAIVTEGILEISQESDNVLFIDTQLEHSTQSEIQKVKGHFFFIPHPESLKKISNSLGVL